MPDEYEFAPDELCEYLSLLGGAYLSLLSMRFKSNLFSLSSSMAWFWVFRSLLLGMLTGFEMEWYCTGLTGGGGKKPGGYCGLISCWLFAFSDCASTGL